MPETKSFTRGAAAPAPSPQSQPATPEGAAEPRVKFHRELFWFGAGYGGVIAGACLYCLYRSAVDDHAALVWLVIRAALAVSELGVPPLAYLARVHSSAAWRAGLATSTMLFAFIIAWNLFLPLDQGMRELIAAPLETRAALEAVEAGPAKLREDAARKRGDYEQAKGRVKDASAALGKLPAQHCWKQHCVNDARGAAMRNELAAATIAVKDLKTKVDAAEKLVADAEGPKGARDLRQAQDNLRHAVNKNMIYGAVATLLGVDPVKISASEMSWAFRLMTITICLAAGALGSVLCLGSVERLPPPKPAPPVKARSAERMELLTAAASEMARAAKDEVVADFASELKAASSKAKTPAASNDNEPKKSPMGEALSEFLTKPKRPRGRPRKAKGNGAAAPAKAAKPRGARPPPESPPAN